MPQSLKAAGSARCIRKLPAEFVLELLERSLAEAHTKSGGQGPVEGHGRVVGSEHATEVESKPGPRG